MVTAWTCQRHQPSRLHWIEKEEKRREEKREEKRREEKRREERGREEEKEDREEREEKRKRREEKREEKRREGRDLRKQVVREGSGTKLGCRYICSFPWRFMQFPLGQTP